MNKFDSGSRERPQARRVRRNFDDKIEYLLSTEEQLLQSISIHGPLPEVLNRICSALDCQIGNVVSLISLPTDGASELDWLLFQYERLHFNQRHGFSEGHYFRQGPSISSESMTCGRITA
jgi:hypothetical protein